MKRIECSGIGPRLQLAGIWALTRLTGPMDHRGLWSLIVRWSKFFSSDNSVVLNLGPDWRLRIYLNDAYWARMLYAGIYCRWGYEVEIERVLRKVLDQQTPFFDCGSNIGYWSTFAASLGLRRVVAVEGSQHNFERLKENARLNGERFVPLHAAISDKAGQPVRFFSHPLYHGQGSLSSPAESRDGATVEEVTTMTIDGLTEGKAAVIKIDVEGAELAAFRGAKASLAAGSLFIYEEHGKADECPVTDWLLECGLAVYFLLENEAVPVCSSRDVLRLMKRSIGYNLAAALPESELLTKMLGKTKAGLSVVNS